MDAAPGRVLNDVDDVTVSDALDKTVSVGEYIVFAVKLVIDLEVAVVPV